MSIRPDFLATNGEIFSLPSVVASYTTRPPYPDEMFDALDRLAGTTTGPVLELGCGPGMVARALVARGRRVVAVDPSEGMIALGKTLPSGDSPNLGWVCSSAESFGYPERYGLVVAALSLHWMDWDAVFPAIRRSLAPGGWLAIVSAQPRPLPWNDQLMALISEYSTIRNWVVHDMFELLDRGGYFSVAGKEKFDSRWPSPIDAYVESFHARSGFAREWMGEARAGEFDAKLRALLHIHGADEVMDLDETYAVTWGRPGLGGS